MQDPSDAVDGDNHRNADARLLDRLRTGDTRSPVRELMARYRLRHDLANAGLPRPLVRALGNAWISLAMTALMDDDALLAVDGIGPIELRAIRAAEAA